MRNACNAVEKVPLKPMLELVNNQSVMILVTLPGNTHLAGDKETWGQGGKGVLGEGFIPRKGH